MILKYADKGVDTLGVVLNETGAVVRESGKAVVEGSGTLVDGLIDASGEIGGAVADGRDGDFYWGRLGG